MVAEYIESMLTLSSHHPLTISVESCCCCLVSSELKPAKCLHIRVFPKPVTQPAPVILPQDECVVLPVVP